MECFIFIVLFVLLVSCPSKTESRLRAQQSEALTFEILDHNELNSQYMGFCLHYLKSSEWKVVSSKEREEIKCGNSHHLIAIAKWIDSVESVGWGQLDVRATDVIGVPDMAKAFGMGYLEGALTATRISQQVKNFHINTFGRSADAASGKFNQPPKKTARYLDEQLKWSKKKLLEKLETNTEPSDKIFWEAIGVVLSQFDGVVRAYADQEGLPLEAAEKQVMAANANNDIFDLLKVYNETRIKPGANDEQGEVDVEDIIAELKKTECSAIIRVLEEGSDVVFGHSTWRPYYGMLRIFKYYSYRLNGRKTTIGFSGSPGLLASHDDFYMTTAGLAVMETTNSVYNYAYTAKYAHPHKLLAWQRAMAANIIAETGPEWMDLVKRYNSGLYCNQWMVLDYNLLKPNNKSLSPGLLTVGEQLPNDFVIGDGTARLEAIGYWPSYNVPYFPSVFNASGYPEKVAQYGDDFSYERCPRAKIFARDAPGTDSLESVQELLRSNNYQTDPLSGGQPNKAISSRYDLRTRPSAFGGVDVKVTNTALFKSLSAMAVCGPTSNSQPVFVWSESNFTTTTAHEGLPDRYEFPWVAMSPAAL